MTAIRKPEFQKGRTNYDEIRKSLEHSGWILLRGENYSSKEFNDLMHALCRQLTYDPARRYASDAVQRVEAGTAAIGLHIENGNTPLPPDIVAFHSVRSASSGSQTTLCDGITVREKMPSELAEHFAKPIKVSRYLPPALWRKYVASALGKDTPDDVQPADLEFFINSIPGQRARPETDGGIFYELTFNAIRQDNLAQKPAFANAILGPSYNYEPPVYCFADGREIDNATLKLLEDLCARHTHEIQWQDGDVAIIDNKRMMHGRRAITVPLEQRELHIGMGIGLRKVKEQAIISQHRSDF